MASRSALGAIDKLELRLFGEDGQGGALGAIQTKVDQGFADLGKRVSTIETDRKVEAGVAVDRRRNADRATDQRRWRGNLLGGLIGGAVGPIVLTFIQIVTHH